MCERGGVGGVRGGVYGGVRGEIGCVRRGGRGSETAWSVVWSP